MSSTYATMNALSVALTLASCLIFYVSVANGLVPTRLHAFPSSKMRKSLFSSKRPWSPSPLAPGPSEHPMYSAEWARERGLEPGYGGIWPGNPDAKKYSVTFKSKKEPGKEYTLMVPSDRYIYFYFEEKGIELPIVNKPRMCRQGCCTICTAKITNDGGKVKMDAPLGLLKEFRDKNYALTCCSFPRSDLICELQDEDETYIKQWSEGFEGGGVEWGGFFLDED